ncbi:MAG: L-arabinose isomerase family protein [Planctomycetota bacterium]
MENGSERRPKVGLLGLTLELYEEMAPDLRPGREEWVRESVLPALRPVADVRFPGAAFRRADVERTVRRFEADGVDALLVMLLTYAPSQAALPALKRTNLPIAVWNTQELRGVGRDFTGDAMVANHGVHGTQDLCNVLLRAGVDFEYFTSHLGDEAPLEPLSDFFAAASAVGSLRTARVGVLGYPFPGMGDFAVDTTHLAATLGCEWTALTVAEYVQRAESQPAEKVEALVADYRAAYRVDPGLSPSALAAAARAELAVRRMVADHSLDAMTYQFLAFGRDERTPTVPFVAASRLMAEGVGFGGEGDLIAAAGTTLLHRLRPPASFTEMFTVDYAGKAVLLSHMGEANVAMARGDRPVRLAERRPIAETREAQLVLTTVFEPGPATLCALTLGPESRWRIVASAGRVLDFGPVDDLVVPHAKWQPDGGVREFLTAYARAGGPHHCAICFGDARARLRAAAGLLDADYREV